jgi:hypothetical protein
MNRQLFIISDEILKAISRETVIQICEDLRTLGLCRAPYDEVTVRLPSSACFAEWMKSDIRPPVDRADIQAQITFRESDPSFFRHEQVDREGVLDVTHFTISKRKDLIAMARDTLIAILAARNAVKTTKKFKDRETKKKTGVRAYDYETTITLPRLLDDDPDHPAARGAPKIPHLRRGHIRDQPHGPGRQSIKKRWIEPMFVNADASFVSTRRAYKVK